MDYRTWVEDAVTFTRNLSRLRGELEVTAEVAPPLSQEKLASIAIQFPSGIPRELARFWTEGSAHLNCRFSWEPAAADMPAFRKVFPFGSYAWGGANICPADYTKPTANVLGKSSNHQNAVEVRMVSIVDGFLANLDADTEEHSSSEAMLDLPFVIHLPGNGDRLALNPGASGADPGDPPVVLLSHEMGGMSLVADRFTTFLQAWQKWSYLGIDRLGWWPATNFPGMDPDGETALALRGLLQRR